MVTKDAPQLITDILPEAVAKIKFSLLHLVRYLIWEVNGNSYLTEGSNGNLFFVTTIGNVLVSSWVLHLVTIPVLDLAMFH